MATRKGAKGRSGEKARAAGARRTAKAAATEGGPYWLAKSEPDVYPIERLEKERTTFWNGVRNYAARNFLRAMKKGDLVLFYHSNADPSGVVGLMEVVGEASADPTQFDASDEMGYDPKASPDSPRWFGVDVRFKERFAHPVALADIKAEPALRNMKLLKVSRLSVSPVTRAEFDRIVAMARKAR